MGSKKTKLLNLKVHTHATLKNKPEVTESFYDSPKVKKDKGMKKKKKNKLPFFSRTEKKSSFSVHEITSCFSFWCQAVKDFQLDMVAKLLLRQKHLLKKV
jgi:hypothetical protein